MAQPVPPQTAGPPLFPAVSIPATSPPLGTDTSPPIDPGPGVSDLDSSINSFSSLGSGPYVPPTPGANVGQYDLWSVTQTYAEDTGLAASPVCGPAGSVMDVVRVHGGATYKVVSFTVRRQISSPTLPSSISTSPNEVLLRREVSLPTPGDYPDGNLYWTVAGRYIYACRVPPSESDIVRCGVSPVNGISIAAGDLYPSVWNQNLIGPQISPAAASGLSPITF
jgi:hypothetical protein